MPVWLYALLVAIVAAFSFFTVTTTSSWVLTVLIVAVAGSYFVVKSQRARVLITVVTVALMAFGVSGLFDRLF